MIEYRYHGKLYSVNHLYGQNKNGRKFLRPEALEIKQELKWVLRGKEIMKGLPKSLQLVFYDNWFTTKKTIKKKDISNLVKLIEDGIAEALGYDDSEHFYVIIEKKQGKEGFYFRIDYL